MLAEKIISLFAYNDWANNQITTQVKNLTDEQFQLVREPIVHMLAVEWLWRMRGQHGLSPKVWPNSDDYPTLAHVMDAWIEETAVRNAWLHTLTDEELEQAKQYKTSKGVAYENTLWEILQHLVLHGSQHRGEVATILTELGYSPGNIDYFKFLRDIS